MPMAKRFDAAQPPERGDQLFRNKVFRPSDRRSRERAARARAACRLDAATDWIANAGDELS
jgi:hypothetical protein